MNTEEMLERMSQDDLICLVKKLESDLAARDALIKALWHFLDDDTQRYFKEACTENAPEFANLIASLEEKE